MYAALDLPQAVDTEQLGRRLAARLEPGSIILLEGELGVGKTTLARGLLHALGHHGPVKSPTYTWVEPYKLSKLSLYHFDFYRFESNTLWRETGFDDLFDGQNVCIVEWPDKVGEKLPSHDLRIRLSYGPEGGRTVRIETNSERGTRLTKGLG